MCRTQLLEVEATLNSTQATLNSTQAMLNSAQATLQQHVLQHEQLMESQQRLRYCPIHQLHSNPSGFGKSSPSWGVILTMVTAAPAKCGGWGRPADPILREAA